MSYILEALRKAERERNPTQSESPRMEPQKRFAQISSLHQLRPYRPLLVAGLCFSLMIALTITLLRHRHTPNTVVVADAAQAVPPLAATLPTQPSYGNDSALTLNQMYSDGSGPATLDDLIDTGSEPASDDFSSVSDVDTSAPAIDAASVASNSTPDESASAAQQPEPARPAPVTSVERVQLDPAPPPQIPKLRDMPADFRAAFPVISLDVHAYDSTPQKRFIMIAGKRYNEGDTLHEGPRIVQIVPEGVVFEFRGEQTLFTIAH